jgi:hypothetical protein
MDEAHASELTKRTIKKWDATSKYLDYYLYVMVDNIAVDSNAWRRDCRGVRARFGPGQNKKSGTPSRRASGLRRGGGVLLRVGVLAY